MLFSDELAAQNKQERFIRGVNGKVSVYDPNYHLCFSAYFNHSHILFSHSTLQSLPLQHHTHMHTNKTELDLSSSLVSNCHAMWKGKQLCYTFTVFVSLSYCHFLIEYDKFIC